MQYIMVRYVYEVWDVMLYLLNCVYTAWYEWHEIKTNDMKYNPVRIMYDMKNDMIWMINDMWNHIKKRYDMYEALAGLY